MNGIDFEFGVGMIALAIMCSPFLLAWAIFGDDEEGPDDE